MEYISKLIKNGDTVLNTKVYAVNGNNETVILLHGGPGVPDEMLEVVEVLHRQYNVITFEQRGVGLSKCGDSGYSIEKYISDLDAIASELNIEKFHLFGHSWGGLYAQVYALKNMDRIKSLFLCSPSSGTNKTWKKTEKEVLMFNKKMTTFSEWMRMGWDSLLGMLGNDKAYRRMFIQVMKNYHSGYGNIVVDSELLDGVYAEPINKTRKAIIEYEPLTEFKNLNFPIVVTYGSNDIYGESKNELINRLPTAEIKIIDKCGHIPWKHNLSEFKKILSNFYLIRP